MGRSKSEQTVLVAVAVLGALLSPAEACTAIGVGRLASTDGSVMVAHTDDSGGMGDPRLARVPARDWPAGAMRPVYLSIADYPRMIAPERSDSYAPRNDVQKSLPWAAPIGFIPQVCAHVRFFPPSAPPFRLLQYPSRIPRRCSLCVCSLLPTELSIHSHYLTWCSSSPRWMLGCADPAAAPPPHLTWLCATAIPPGEPHVRVLGRGLRAGQRARSYSG